MSMFKKAVKAESKLRLVVAGPSGSGKTYTGLAIASALADGAPIAVVDTEHGSASKYADLFNFDVAEMHPPFHPDKFVQAIQDAAAAGYAVIILDSLTHAWSGTGGMLDLIDEIAKRKTSGNSFAAWKDGTPIQNRLIDAIVSAPIHVIATIRSKQDYVQDKDDRGKTVVRKVGMAAQQREGFEYEFDVAFDMDIDNNAIVSKTRCPALTGRVFSKPGRDVASILAEWLRGEPAPQPPTRQEVTTTTTTTPAGAAAATNGTTTGIATANGNGGTNGHGAPVANNGQVDTQSPAFKACMTKGVEVFGLEWKDARPWLVERYTTKETPDNIRISSKDLTDAELKTITGWLAEYGKGLRKSWTEHREAKRAELDAITVNGAQEMAH